MIRRTAAFVVTAFFLARAANGVPLNEWTFEKDAPGLTLSQAFNSGSEGAVFESGGDGFLLTDGAGGQLVCTYAGDGGAVPNGTVLHADVIPISSGRHYLRWDMKYDLSSAQRTEPLVFGLSFIDSSTTNVAGISLYSADESLSGSDDWTVSPVATELAWSGEMSVIAGIDMDTQTMTVWYDASGSNYFDESSPAISDLPVYLTSIDKLQVQATGEFRPEGTACFAALDNIRTASSWEEMIQPVSLALSVHPLFANHVVLQRDREVPVWGHVSPGAPVTLALDGDAAGTAVADANGLWTIRLDARSHDGGVPHIITISSPGETDIQISDVVFGDVYLASGQSNMEWSLNNLNVPGLAGEIAESSAYALIRQVTIARTNSAAEWTEPIFRSAGWVTCSPASVSGFSATAYFFAKNMYLSNGVPVGLIVSAWGGQPIERFLSPSGLVAVPELAGMRQIRNQGGTTALCDIYNAMIAPLIPFGLRGAIWYQGEANANDGDLYRYKMQALIRGWRQQWSQGNFPFCYVQLPNLLTANDWPGVREAQLKALSETNTGMAVAIDIGADRQIHPPNKQDVGWRLAQWMLGNGLQYDLIPSGPLFHHALIEEDRIRILFTFAEDGLLIGSKESTNEVVVTDGPLQNFEIAGADKQFVRADAVVDKDSVLVSSPDVSAPLYVRYCYTSAPSGANKLYNSQRLPASPFRTDRTFRLEVVSGSGSGTGLAPGTPVIITADTPPDGKVFDRWIGASSEVNFLNAATSIVVMPDRSLYLVASYRDADVPVYTLTVNNGSGAGTSQAGSVLNVAALSNPNQFFDHWSGETQDLVDVHSPYTTLCMPANDVTITAVYRTADSVGDGIPDEWRARYFGGTGATASNESSADTDFDGDGMSNYQEYKAGTSPVDPFSFLLLECAASGKDLTFGFQSVSGCRYRLETTVRLVTPVWTALVYNLAGDGKRKHHQFAPDSSSSRFFRLLINAE